jgi:hypothetical protein
MGTTGSKYYEGWSTELKPRRTPFSQAPIKNPHFFKIRKLSYLLDPKREQESIDEAFEKIPMGYAQLFYYVYQGAFYRKKCSTKSSFVELANHVYPRVNIEYESLQPPEILDYPYTKLNRRKWAGKVYFILREQPTPKTQKSNYLISTASKDEAIEWAVRITAKTGGRTVVGLLTGDIQWH